MNIGGLYYKETLYGRAYQMRLILALVLLALLICSHSVAALPYFPTVDGYKELAVDQRKPGATLFKEPVIEPLEYLLGKNAQTRLRKTGTYDQTSDIDKKAFLKMLVSNFEEEQTIERIKRQFVGSLLLKRDLSTDTEKTEYSRVPEPGTLSMMVLGLLTLVLFRHRAAT